MSYVLKFPDGTYAKGHDWCRLDRTANLQEARTFRRRCDAMNSNYTRSGVRDGSGFPAVVEVRLFEVVVE